MTRKRIALYRDHTLDITMIRGEEDEKYMTSTVRMSAFVEVDFPPLEPDPLLLASQAAKIDEAIAAVEARNAKSIKHLTEQKTAILSAIFQPERESA